MARLMRCCAAFVEIFLVVSFSVSFAYLLHEADRRESSSADYLVLANKDAARLLATLGSLLFDTLATVSALETSDVQQGLQTCLLSKDGKSCQEYLASECASKCSSACIPSPRKNVAACKPGTCYDANEGTCQTGSPQSTCTAAGGQWFDDPYENIPQCREGCCLIGGAARFITEQQCVRQAAFLGALKEFRADVRNELQCLALASVQEEGACVFVKEFERGCSFVTKSQCLQLKGDFYPRLLCSNEALNTTCKAQQTTGCGTALDGTQKVYWFDSCGNRENVYDYNRRIELQRLGALLPANESCNVGARDNPVMNARLCGNCNYLLGSTCGPATEQEKAAIGNSVCRDLSCIDEQGKKRAHGESWCQYQGAIGVDSVKNRGRDTPGSRHFRKVCIKGEVRTEPCADYRNEICVESRAPVEGGMFSSAACKLNLAYQCFDYNGIANNEQNRGLHREALQLKEAERNRKCEQNPDCFVKRVRVGGEFSFDYCVPKYKPGFASAERGDIICSQASVSCTAVYVKGLGGWKCKGNCDCEKAVFAEQLNDFCMSLGDCGGQVNHEGKYSENYRVTGSGGKLQKASQTYVTELVKYAEPIKGAFIEAPDAEQFYSFLGIPAGLGQASEPGDLGAALNGVGTIAGAMGVVLLVAAKTSLGFQALSSVGLAAGNALVYTKAGWAVKPMLNAYGGALAGAAIGFSATALLLKYTGVGRGLPAAVTYLLLAAGTTAGAIIGAALAVKAGATTSGFIGQLAALGPYGWIVLAVVVVIILILKLFGIGKMKKVTTSFTCNPWQAPSGGNACKQCGTDGLLCTPYACASLGQSCQLVNGDTENQECIGIVANDTAAPAISFDPGTLPVSNYTIEPYELGVKIINKMSSDGCIQESFVAVPLRISLNEPGQCAASNESGVAFNDMGEDFSSITKNRYAKNHTRFQFIPSLESLGFESFDPRARVEQNVFVKCNDAVGNANSRDFAISYCVKQGPDMTPPSIVDHDPALETAAFGVTNTSVNIYTSEPASCHWSMEDGEYAAMSGEMSCEDGIDERTLRGWRCSTSVPVKNTETTYFVRCLDQPWLNESEQTKRNANSESYRFRLRQSAIALQIDAVSPNGETLSFGTEPASVTVAVKTSGGVDGSARCQFSWQNGSWIDFADGWGTRAQQQVFQTVYSGAYELPIRCEDAAGNVAAATARFTIHIDNQPPHVTRVYRDGGNLVVITDETSQCVASTLASSPGEQGCSYAWENGTSMGIRGMRHSIAWRAGATYYIKCKDRFERNPGTSCTLEVQGVGAGEA